MAVKERFYCAFVTDYFSPYFYQGSETAEVFSRLTVVADFRLTHHVVAMVVVVVFVVAAVSEGIE